MTDTRELTPVREGDIFSASWGYDQTNVDYYKVTRATEKTAWLVEIGCTSIEGSQGFMSDTVMPNPDVVLCSRCGQRPDGWAHRSDVDAGDNHHDYIITPTRHRIQVNYDGTSYNLKVRDFGVWAHRVEGAGREYRSWYA